MTLKPQTRLVLSHLDSAGSITAVEASAVHRVRHLPARIFELKKAGYSVSKTMRKDVTGQVYAHYTLGA